MVHVQIVFDYWFGFDSVASFGFQFKKYSNNSVIFEFGFVLEFAILIWYHFGIFYTIFRVTLLSENSYMWYVLINNIYVLKYSYIFI